MKIVTPEARSFEPRLSENVASLIIARPEECYRNAVLAIYMLRALRERGARYVEGTCVYLDHGIPVEHGWLVLDDGTIVDPTAALLANGSDVRYFPGVSYTAEEVRDRVEVDERHREKLPYVYGKHVHGMHNADYCAAYESALSFCLSLERAKTE